jgi:hypothetical protein
VLDAVSASVVYVPAGGMGPTPLATPCIEWQGLVSLEGYGRLRRDGRLQYVHRYVWSLVHGPIPDGMCVLHRCDNPRCFRLDHLFLGSHLDNIRDMAAKGRLWQQRVTHCPQGHPYDDANTMILRSGARRCRACGRERNRRARQSRGAQC